ncbi:MAG: SDR family NAD(P)-dependent oxidoreductase [Syntrophorhabdales bacterium]
MSRQQVSVLSGRAALVTGGNRGLGLEIARALASAGASVMLCAREEEPLKVAAATLAGLASKEQSICWERCDITDSSQVSSVVDELHYVPDMLSKGIEIEVREDHVELSL